MSIPLGRESAPPTQMKQCMPSHPQLARALYDNMAESPDELAFRRGELLTVLEQDAAGSSGWWLCSLRGRQGICPGNRLRLVSGPLEGAPPRTARRSAAATPRALSPQPAFTKLPPMSTAVSAAEQAYDIPRAPVAVSAAGPGAWYETPRPASADSACSTGAYDVPRARALPLPRDAALDALERLQAEAAAAVARLLAHVRPGWRRREALAESALDVRVAAARLRAALHDLAVFADAALANAAEAQDKGLSVKMRPLVKALKDAERVTHEATSALESGGWSVERLARDVDTPPADDALDRLVTCARALTEDVRRAASFIQGNAPLLFPRAPPAAAWTEEYDYVRLESRAALEHKHAEIRAALPDKLRSSFDALVRDADSAAGEAGAAAVARPDADDRRLAAFYAAQAATYGAHLAAAVDAFLRTLRLEQPPPVFLAHGKFVVLSAHRLVHVGDTVHRSAQHAGLRARALRCSDALSDALAGTVAATKAAAQRFPCARAASEATGATRTLAERALELRRALVAAAAAADPPHD